MEKLNYFLYCWKSRESPWPALAWPEIINRNSCCQRNTKKPKLFKRNESNTPKSPKYSKSSKSSRSPRRPRSPIGSKNQVSLKKQLSKKPQSSKNRVMVTPRTAEFSQRYRLSWLFWNAQILFQNSLFASLIFLHSTQFSHRIRLS